MGIGRGPLLVIPRGILRESAASELGWEYYTSRKK
jgi:hypothetical protein